MAQEAHDVIVKIRPRTTHRGFDVQSMQALSASIGLLGMQERAVLAGGRLEIASGPQGGTRVSAFVPLSFGKRGSDA
jgi:signal transduction histidine kinase